MQPITDDARPSPSASELRTARCCHLVVAAVTAAALVFQLALVVRGSSVLVTEDLPSLPVRLVRFVSYFTILSNLLVLVTAVTLVTDPLRDGRIWRVLRLDAVVGITATGLIHWFFLRPILDLHGASFVADKLVHVVVPVLALAVWVAVGPRDRVARADVPASLVYPAGWLVLTLVRGAVTGWYPYPFVDADLHGYGVVTLNALAITVLLLALTVGVASVDRIAPGARGRRRLRTRRPA